MGTIYRRRAEAFKQGKIVLIAIDSTTSRGRAAEDVALNYLKNNGLKPLIRNYRTPYGEIDLVMKDGDTTVFIEVRSRTKSIMLDTLETVDHNKCMRIIASSEFYLQRNNSAYNEKFRFDVVTLSGPPGSARMEWIKNAFQA